MKTSFTRLVGCTVPIQQASFGPLSSTPSLCVAVSEAGGLGMLGGTLLSSARMMSVLHETESLTDRPFGVNFICDFVEHDIVEEVAQNCKVVEFFFGEPDQRLVDRGHSGGALVSWQVGSVAEGMRAQDVGCDFIVAQGVEAGGHVRGTTSLLTLVDSLSEKLHVPLVAAGGIGSGNKMAAMLVAGAAAVRVGTRFLAAEEASAHPRYKKALIEAGEEETVLTHAFSSGWDKPHRVLKTAIDAATEYADGAIVGEFELGGMLAPADKFNMQAPSELATGDIRAMALYAGESVGRVTGIVSAGSIVRELVSEATEVLCAVSTMDLSES